jgi:tetratricopeptide (TPR) repeat protein
VLVVLDNARDAEQVRPLLPGSPTCVVVITSRDQLVDLVTWEGARPINLDAFDLSDALALLVRRIGQHRMDDDPEAVIHLLDRCARLPLAVAIVAARLELNPRLSIRMLADELAGESTRLDVLDELRTVVASSYQHLDPASAQMFRLLGLHPGAEASTSAAASLAGIPVDQARTTLNELTQAHLFLEVEPGRFAFHDLLRAYAMTQTAAVDTAAARRAATHRLLDHLLHTSFAAGEFIVAPYQDIYPDKPPQPGVAVGAIQNYQHAKSWFAAEHQNLLLAIEHAAQQEFDVHTWKLAWSLSAFLDWQGHWQDLLNLEGSILSAVDRTGDDFARARVHVLLGWMSARIGNSGQAQDHACQSLKLCRKIGDGLGEASSHFVLAMAFGVMREEQASLEHAQRALDFFHSQENLGWQARTHRVFAWVRGQCGNHSEALKHCEQALHLLRQIGGSHYELATLENMLAWTRHHLGDHDEAIAHYGNAIAMYQELADHYNEAEVFRRVGDTLLAAGRVVGARASWLRAMDIIDRFNLPNVERLRQRLTKRLNQVPAPTD